MNGGISTAAIFLYIISLFIKIYIIYKIKEEKRFASLSLYSSNSILIVVSSPNDLNTFSISVSKASL